MTGREGARRPFLRELSNSSFVSPGVDSIGALVQDTNRKREEGRASPEAVASLALRDPNGDVLLVDANKGRGGEDWKLPEVYINKFLPDEELSYLSYLALRVEDYHGVEPTGLQTYEQFALVSGQLIVPTGGTFDSDLEMTRMGQPTLRLPAKEAVAKIGDERPFQRLACEIITLTCA